MEPGFSWFVEKADELHIVEVGIELDSHGMLYVLLPGDARKYPIVYHPASSGVSFLLLISLFITL